MLGVDDVHEAAHERQKHAQLVTDQVPRVDDRQGDRDQADDAHANALLVAAEATSSHSPTTATVTDDGGVSATPK